MVSFLLVSFVRILGNLVGVLRGGLGCGPSIVEPLLRLVAAKPDRSLLGGIVHEAAPIRNHIARGVERISAGTVLALVRRRKRRIGLSHTRGRDGRGAAGHRENGERNKEERLHDGIAFFEKF